MNHLFISYASEDTATAQQLADAFANEGWDVWWDKNIPPGLDYAQVIEKAISDAHCVVVLWSRHSVRSRWVQIEAAAGADRNVVATVLIDDTPLDQIPFEFRRLQAVDLSDWRLGQPHAGYDMLANRVRSILDEPLRPVTSIQASSGNATWWEALTSWGQGRQPLLRAAAVLAGLAGVAVASGLVGIPETWRLVGLAGLGGLSIALFGAGRLPA